MSVADVAGMAEAPLPFPRTIPFVQTLGVELWQFGGGTAELRLPVQPGQLNSHGIAHGGVLMTLLDVVMATPRAAPTRVATTPASSPSR